MTIAEFEANLNKAKKGKESKVKCKYYLFNLNIAQLNGGINYYGRKF